MVATVMDEIGAIEPPRTDAQDLAEESFTLGLSVRE